MNEEKLKELEALLVALPDDQKATVGGFINWLLGEMEAEHDRLSASETALFECRKALKQLFDWHKGFRSRHSEECDLAVRQAQIAAVYIGKYLEIYGQQQPVILTPRGS